VYESLSHDILTLELFVLLAVSRDLFLLIQICFTVTLRQYLLNTVSISLKQHLSTDFYSLVLDGQTESEHSATRIRTPAMTRPYAMTLHVLAHIP
jgi:hypothetical protein